MTNTKHTPGPRYTVVAEPETPRTNGGFRVVRDDGISCGFVRTEKAAAALIRKLESAS